MSKFSKLLPIERHAVVAFFLICFGTGGEISHCCAQQPTPVSQPTKAFVRFWNMLPDKATNALVLFAGDKDAITAAATNNIYADYLPVPAGSYSLVVKRADEKATLVQRLPATLPPNGFFSVLATEKNGQPAVEIFNDTPDPKVVDSRPRLMLRQFFPGAKVSVSINGGAPSQLVGYQETAVLENLPVSEKVNIILQVTLPTTPTSTRTWPLTADLSVARRATLLLVADTYGRPRPQLCYDGHLNALSPPAASPPPHP